MPPCAHTLLRMVVGVTAADGTTMHAMMMGYMGFPQGAGSGPLDGVLRRSCRVGWGRWGRRWRALGLPLCFMSIPLE